MRPTSSPTIPISLSAQHRHHFRTIIEELDTHYHTPNVSAFLRRLNDDLEQLERFLPAAERALLRELDDNAQALCNALQTTQHLCRSLQPILDEYQPGSALIDAARLRGLATHLGQLAQVAGEAALRAQDRANLLER